MVLGAGLGNLPYFPKDPLKSLKKRLICIKLIINTLRVVFRPGG